jgi:putative ABC transport system substrate-binding protein
LLRACRGRGNATGINFFSTEILSKRLGLLHDLVPKAVRIAVLINPANARANESTLHDVTEAARGLGLQIQVLNASNGDEIDAAYTALASDRADALLVAPDIFLLAGACKLPSCRRAIWFPQYIRCVTMPRLVD